MPYVHRTIPEVHKTVIRPVVAEVVKDVLKATRIDDTVTPVEFLGSMSNLIPRKGSIDSATEDENTFSTKQKVTISVSDEYTDMNLMSSGVLKQNAPLVFKDDRLKTYLYPVYQQKEFSIDIVLHAPDRVTVGRWIRNIRSRIASMVVNSLHHVEYSYTIPTEVMVLMADVHRRSEIVAPYGDSIGKWLKERFSKKFTFVTNQAGRGATPVIREAQIQVMGNYSFGMDTPRPERKSDMNGGWEIQFTYKFWFDVPEEMVLSFPLMTHQTLLDAKYIDYSLPEWVDIYRSNESYSAHVLSYFNSNNQIQHPLDITPGIPIPTCDDWNRSLKQNKYYTDVFRIMIQLEPESGLLCNLAELGDFAFTPLCLEYIRSTYKKMTGSYYHNVLHLSVWRWDQLQDFYKVRVDENLDVWFDEPMDLRDNYHLVIEIVNDPSVLLDDALADLANNACWFIEYIDRLFPGLFHLMPKNIIDCKTDINSIRDTIRQIDATQGKGGHNLALYPKSLLPVTVGSFTILAGDQDANR